jgi:hypothetical protein
MKTQFGKDSKYEIPFHSIKGFLHVNLDGHKPTPTSFGIHCLKKLMRHNSIILNRSGRDKGRLMRINKAVEQTFEPVRQNFGNNFINDVAEANRME